MSVKFCVITKVPDPEQSGGNLAAAFPLYEEVESPAESNGWNGKYRSRHDLLLSLHEPVFSVGEILIVDGEYGREYGYPGRKPSKWSVEAVFFDTVDKAIERSRAVMDASR